MSLTDDHMVSNVSGNETIHEVVEARLSRRGLIGGGVAGAAALSGVGALLNAVPVAAEGATRRVPGRGASQCDRIHLDPAIVG